jgi:hypothetical protein
MNQGYRISPDVVFRPEGETGIVFFPDSGEIETLNEVGTLALQSLEQGLDLGAMAQRVATAFEMDAETAQKDLQEFFADLESRGVLERRIGDR